MDGSHARIQAAYSTDGGKNWIPATAELSADGQDADTPEIAINSTSGDAICVWTRRDGTHWRIQSAYSDGQ